MLGSLLFRTMIMPILFWSVIGGIVALAVKVATRRPTMPIWPIVPFALWGVVRALIRAWHVFS